MHIVRAGVHIVPAVNLHVQTLAHEPWRLAKLAGPDIEHFDLVFLRKIINNAMVFAIDYPAAFPFIMEADAGTRELREQQ